MNEKRFEKDFDENVCSFDYSTLDTYYEYNVSNEEIIEWNKHSSNAQYRNLKHIAEILNIKQMRLESLMEHREEIGKLFDRIEEQQSTISSLKEENEQLRLENMRLKKAEKINMEYAEQIVEENQQLRIAKNDLRIENEQLYLAIDDLLSHTSCEEIKKENEQLRKVCSHLKKENQSLIENIFDIYKNLGYFND